MKMEDATSASSSSKDPEAEDDPTIGKDTFWSPVNENYALLVDINTSPPSHSLGDPNIVDQVARSELDEAFEKIKRLRSTNSQLGQKILSLENARSTGKSKIIAILR